MRFIQTRCLCKINGKALKQFLLTPQTLQGQEGIALLVLIFDIWWSFQFHAPAWSEKIEIYRNGSKWNLYRFICWLIVEVILRNARCNDEIRGWNRVLRNVLTDLQDYVIIIIIINTIIINTIIIIIIIRHQSVLHISNSPNTLFNSLPNRLLPIGLQFSIISAKLLLFILVKCSNQFGSYLLQFHVK